MSQKFIVVINELFWSTIKTSNISLGYQNFLAVLQAVLNNLYLVVIFLTCVANIAEVN